LGEPPLDPPGGHGQHLGLHGVVQRLGHQVAERLDEGVGPLSSVEVQHGDHPSRAQQADALVTMAETFMATGQGGGYATDCASEIVERSDARDWRSNVEVN
jgi:hypothetical protein